MTSVNHRCLTSPSIEDLISRTNSLLDEVLKNRHTLDHAMRYSTLNGGKRFRAILTYSTGLCFNASINDLDAAAIAVELIHCFSLIHDDLPAMDDDDLRRGKLTCHKKFNEATAILAGDALHSLAFYQLCQSPVSDNIKIKMIAELTHATGAEGMTYGQLLDLEAEGTTCSLQELDHIHNKKTGTLIQAASIIGGYIAGCNAHDIQALKQFGSNLGLIFQIKDDLLEQQSNTVTLGKSNQSDISNQKSTYPKLLGITKAQHHLDKIYQQAATELSKINTDTSRLQSLLDWSTQRKY
jgi:farnesyl diphosphate synthase